MGKSKTIHTATFGKGKHATTAAVVTYGKYSGAAVKSLRVMILPDGDGWFAQGLEIDYFACGKTSEEAKHLFSKGLCLTIQEHLKMFGHIKELLVPAPVEDWKEFYDVPPGAERSTVDVATACQTEAAPEKRLIERVTQALPFDSIEFIKGEVALPA